MHKTVRIKYPNLKGFHKADPTADCSAQVKSMSVTRSHTVRHWLGNHEDVIFAIAFLQSLLIAWFLSLIPGTDPLPGSRLIMGLIIVFAILMPAFMLLEGFRYSSILAGFFVPLVLYALMYPLFVSFISHANMFLEMSVVAPALVGGIGFGLIGLAAYHSRTAIINAIVLATAGLTIVFLSSPGILTAFLFVVTGDFTSFPALII